MVLQANNLVGNQLIDIRDNLWLRSICHGVENTCSFLPRVEGQEKIYSFVSNDIIRKIDEHY